MQGRLEFQVQGSEPAPYVVVFSRAGDLMTATCTCAAGSVGQHCKHRLDLLAGEVSGLVSENSGDVSSLPAMLAGTNIARVFAMLAEAEAGLAAAKKRVSDCKKALGREMCRS